MSEFKSNYDAQVEDFTDELSDEALDRSSQRITAAATRITGRRVETTVESRGAALSASRRRRGTAIGCRSAKDKSFDTETGACAPQSAQARRRP